MKKLLLLLVAVVLLALFVHHVTKEPRQEARDQAQRLEQEDRLSDRELLENAAKLGGSVGNAAERVQQLDRAIEMEIERLRSREEAAEQ